MNGRKRLSHFLLFFFLVIPYLFYRLLCYDLIYLTNKSTKKVKDNFDFIFDESFYKIFKRVIMTYAFLRK